jgi:hypothetical protein
MKNKLTVVDCLNIDFPFDFGYGVAAVNRVGHVHRRKLLLALRKENGMRQDQLQVFLVR